MARIHFQNCSNCVRRATCRGVCTRTPQNAPRTKQNQRRCRIWQGRMFVQKVLDIEDTLPPYQRKIAKLYYREGLTQKEIGYILGVNQSSVSRVLARVHAHVHRLYHDSVRRLHEKHRRVDRKEQP